MASMILFFNVYVQENDNYVRKRKQRKHRKEVKQNAKNKWNTKDLIHLHCHIKKRSSNGGVTTRLPRVQLYKYGILYVLKSVARKRWHFGYFHSGLKIIASSCSPRIRYWSVARGQLLVKWVGEDCVCYSWSCIDVGKWLIKFEPTNGLVNVSGLESFIVVRKAFVPFCPGKHLQFLG